MMWNPVIAPALKRRKAAAKGRQHPLVVLELSGNEYIVKEWGAATNLRRAVSREPQCWFKHWGSFRLQKPDGTVMDDASYLTKAHTAMLDALHETGGFMSSSQDETI